MKSITTEKKEYKRLWHQRNKEKIQNYQKIYYLENKKKAAEYRFKNKDKIKERMCAWRLKSRNKISEYQKEYRSTHGRTSKEITSQNEKYRKKYPERIKAHQAVKRALKKGNLTRLSCVFCNSLKTDAHHDSYAPEKRLNVVWMCKKHHASFHQQKRDLEKENGLH